MRSVVSREGKVFLIFIASTLSAACAPEANDQPVPAKSAYSEQDVEAQGSNRAAASPKDATYLFDGTPVTLKSGVAEEPAAQGSMARVVTRYAGGDVALDLNGDGRKDTAFILTQDYGGSGVFYFVVAALKTGKGYLGTEATFLGDRISLQKTFADPSRPYRFTVTYADRRDDESFADPPSVSVSKTFRLVSGRRLEEIQR